MIGLAVAVVLPLILAFPATLWCTRHEPFRRPWLLASVLAPALGLGISSCVFFLWFSLPSAGFITLVLFELVFYIAGGIGFGWALLTSPRSEDAKARAPDRDRLGLIIATSSLAVLACAGLTFILVIRASPHGGFDASAIWNLRARFLYRIEASRRLEAFPLELPWTHPDYPLLLPGSIARSWLYAKETTWAPRLIAGIFTFCVPGLLYAALARLRSSTQGFLALATLLGTAQFIDVGSAQYADIPLSFYLLAALVLLVVADNEPRHAIRCEILAGILAGMAAWTKNEGCLCLVVVLAVRFAALCLTGPLRRAIREWMATVIGALPMVLFVLCFKLLVAPPNDLMASQNWGSVWAKLRDFTRYWLILKFYGQQLASMGGGAAFFLAGYWLLMGRAPRSKRIKGTGQAFAVVLLVLAGYFVVHLISYWYLRSHLMYSVERLWVHVWPAALLAFFLYVATPEEAVTNRLRALGTIRHGQVPGAIES